MLTDMEFVFFAGSGFVQQSILTSASYYIAVGNLNSEKVEVICKLLDLFMYNQLVSSCRNVPQAINKDLIHKYLISSITIHR